MPRLRRPRIRIINNDEIMASAGNPSTSNEVILGLHRHARKKQFDSHSVDKFRKLSCYKRLLKKKILQVLSLCIFLNFGYSPKHFAQIYRAQYGAAMLEYLRGTPTWRSEKSVNIWILLCLSRRMIICIETSIYTSSFPNT